MGWSKQDEYFYDNNNGATWDSVNSIWIPASQKAGFEGLDVLGDALSHPPTTAIQYALNNTDCDIKQPLDQRLIDADTLEFWYDKTVPSLPVANEISYSEFVANYHDYLYANIISLVEIGGILTYSTAQSLADQILIDKCFLKAHTLIAGNAWSYDADGLLNRDSDGIPIQQTITSLQFALDENSQYIILI
jgi:hypothetical protein